MKFEKIIYVLMSTVIISLLILISNFLPISSSSTDKGKSVTKIYYADNISKAHQRVIDSFNKKYFGQIEVKAINLPFEKFSTNERKELLARYLRNKSDRIDLFAVDLIWVPRFAKWCIPLDRYFSKKQQEEFIKPALSSCYYDDSLMALPLYIDVALMFYRSDELKKLPNYTKIKEKLNSSITWEEFIELHKQTKSTTNPFFTFQADDYEGLICIFVEIMSSLGKPLVVNDSLQLHTKEAKKALKFLVDLVNLYHISPKEVINFKENHSYGYFLNNNGIFVRGWPSFLSLDNKAIEKKRELLKYIDKAATPYFDGKIPSSVFGGWNLMVSKYSTKIPETIKLIEFLMSEEAQKIMYEEGSYLPTRESIYKDSFYIAQNSDLVFYKNLFERGVHRPFLKNYTYISDVLSYYINLAIKQKIGVDEALETASEIIFSKSIVIK
ncbi:MAG: extracellular solute-binding protein [Bacteroidetes bacterium]|nr:extracellular solute-binding protein [Bacteroidota bacterium]MBU2585892.1 extracellular solute-binding protein [Bacteroidota bacterium]